MKRLFLLLHFLLFIAILSGQVPVFEWARHQGGVINDEGRSIACDSWGNIYITGVFQGTADFDPGPGVYSLTAAGEDDIFVSKLNTLGDFEWAVSFGNTSFDTGFGITVDSLANVYVTGSFSGTIDFDPGPGVYSLSPLGVMDIFIFKLDAQGQFVWARNMGGASLDRGLSIAVDNNGNIYTTGWFRNTADFDPGPDTFSLSAPGVNENIFILKLDVDGNFVWAKSIGGELHDRGHSIVLDAMNNVYTTGRFEGTVDFDPGPNVFNLIANGPEDMFISKLDVDGNFVLAKNIGGTSFVQGNGIAVDNMESIYTIGEFQGTADFDPGPGVYNLFGGGEEDIFISKLDASGNFAWAKRIGDEDNDSRGHAIATDIYSNVYTTGRFDGSVDFDPDNAGGSLSGSEDVFISKFDENGNYIWAGELSGQGFDFGFSIVLDDLGNIYSTGCFSWTMDFNPSGGVSELTSNGINDIYVHKMRQCLAQPNISSTNSLSTVCPGDSIELSVSMPSWATDVSYIWSSGDTLANIIVVPDSNTIYTVDAHYNSGCINSASIEIAVYDSAQITLANHMEICTQDTVVILAQGGVGYLWSNGHDSDLLEISPQEDQLYFVTVTDANDCTAVDSISVSVNPLPEPNITGEVEVCPGDTTVIIVEGGTQYLWDNGSIENTLSVISLIDSEYTVTVTNEFGCSAISSTMVFIGEEFCPPCATFPTAFTPDSDGVNDLFRPLPADNIEVLDFRIYNRWGQLIHDGPLPWDGRSQNQPQPSDVYIYVARVRSTCGVDELRGEVTLVR